MFADRHLRGTYVVVAFVATGIFYGAAVAALTDNWYLAVVAVIGLIAGIVTFIEPVWGLYLFVATMFAEGLLIVASGFTASKLLGILVFGAWVVHSLVIEKHFRIVLPVQCWFIIGFVAWGWLSALWALDAQLVFSRIPTLIQSVGLYILVVNLVNSPERVRNLLFIIITVSLVLALLTIFNLFSGEVVAGRADAREVSGDDPNFLAAHILPTAALLMALFSRETRLSRRLFLLAVLSLAVIGILSTSSRGGVVALAVILIFSPMLDRKMWRVVFPALLVIGAIPYLLPETVLGRIESIFTLSNRGTGRLDIWLVAWHMFRVRPLLGVGLGNFGMAFRRHLADTVGLGTHLFLPPTVDPHNIYINTLSSLGVIGFALFIIVVGLSVKNGLVAVLRLKRKGDPHLTTLAIGAYLSLLGVLSAGMFIDLDDQKYFWLLLALAEVMRRLSLAPAREDSRDSNKRACRRERREHLPT